MRRTVTAALLGVWTLLLLAGIMESRLERMPRDTIEELVAILQRYLEGGE